MEGAAGGPHHFHERVALLDSLGRDPSMVNIKSALEVLLTMRSSELRRAIEEVENEHARRLIIDRWVELDPRGVLGYINQSDEREYRLVRELIQHWSKTDPKRAIDAIEQMPENLQSYAYYRLLEYMGGQEPERILAVIQSGKMGDRVGNRYYRLFAKWGESDPDTAFAAIRNLPEDDQTIAYRGYFDGLVRIDPHLALSQAESVSTHFKQRRDILASLYADWMEIDIDAAFESLGQIESATLRGNLVRRFAYDMPLHDPEKLMGLIHEHTDGRWERDIIREFIRDLARRDPRETAGLIDNMPFGDAYSDSVQRLMDYWADDDPVSALSWARTLPPGQERERALREGLREYARLDAGKAFDFLNALPPGERDLGAWESLAHGLADDPIRGMELIAVIEDDNLYHRVQTKLIQGWMRNDPQAALTFSEEYEIDLGPQASSIGYEWSRRDPQAAFDWAMTLDDENAQRSAMRNIARNWVSHDSLEASKAIADMQPGRARDVAIRELVNKIRGREPAAAFDWALGADNVSTRRQLVTESLRSWKDRDPAAAARALRDSGLPDEEINRLRANLGLE